MDAYSVKVKCGSCNKNKSRELFSKTALAKYQDAQKKRARNANVPVKPIFCLACNSSNREELQCAGCRLTMALEKFNKTQRRKNDEALCLDCSQEKIDREPDHEKEVEEVIIIENIKRSEIQDYSYNGSRMSSAHRSRLESAGSQYETETNPGSQSWAAGNDAVSLVSSGSSGYSSANSRPATHTGWDSFQGIKQSTTTSRTGSNTGFAKQNAVPKNTFDKATAQYQREQRRTQEQDEVVRDESDGEDDDSDDAPY